METPVAEVLSIDDSHVRLRVAGGFACARCAAGRGCGAGILGGRQPAREFRLPRPQGMHLRPGDRVRLALAPRQLLRASGIAYGLPLLALVLVPFAASGLWGPLSDPVLAVAGLAGVTVAVLAGRRLLGRDPCLQSFTPVVAGPAEPSA